MMLSDSFDHMVRRIQKLMEQVRQEEITLRKTELKALQAQINPHFYIIHWMQLRGYVKKEEIKMRGWDITPNLAEV